MTYPLAFGEYQPPQARLSPRSAEMFRQAASPF